MCDHKRVYIEQTKQGHREICQDCPSVKEFIDPTRKQWASGDMELRTFPHYITGERHVGFSHSGAYGDR